jgi:hypothetical protein
MLHIHLYLSTRRTSGRILGTFKQSDHFWGFRRKYWIETYFNAVSGPELASRRAPSACNWPQHVDNHGLTTVNFVSLFLVLTEVNPNICAAAGVCVCVCVCVQLQIFVVAAKWSQVWPDPTGTTGRVFPMYSRWRISRGVPTTHHNWKEILKLHLYEQELRRLETPDFAFLAVLRPRTCASYDVKLRHFPLSRPRLRARYLFHSHRAVCRSMSPTPLLFCCAIGTRDASRHGRAPVVFSTSQTWKTSLTWPSTFLP